MFNREFRHEKTFKLDWSIAAYSFEKQLCSQGASSSPTPTAMSWRLLMISSLAGGRSR